MFTPFRPLIIALLLAGASAGSARVGQACMLDQQPSISANGQLATVNPRTPRTWEQMANWAYFIFPRHYSAHQTIVLTENRPEVARALAQEALRQPWRWHFGDGQTAVGWTVRHTYAGPRQWRISVDAYAP
ncbi:MAG TPA: hypothetical protein VNL71_06485, partial [Chloroflexota bacterium]|nr:hypothetical protein [Chloroflexota bacterium]